MRIRAWRRAGVAQILESMNNTYFITQLLLELNTICQIVSQEGEKRIAVSTLLGRFWSTSDSQSCTSFRCARQWLGPCGRYHTTSAAHRVAICLHTRLLWGWCLHETKLLYAWSAKPLICHPCHSLPQLLPSGDPLHLLWICGSVSISVCLLCFLDSTYKWNHRLFVFLCLILHLA